MGVQSWPAGTLALPPCSAPSLGVFLITVLRGSGRWLDGVPAVSRVLSLLLQLPVSSLHGLQSFSVSLLVLFAILLQKSSSIRIDDSMDVFAEHGVAGMVGL